MVADELFFPTIPHAGTYVDRLCLAPGGPRSIQRRLHEDQTSDIPGHSIEAGTRDTCRNRTPALSHDPDQPLQRPQHRPNEHTPVPKLLSTVATRSQSRRGMTSEDDRFNNILLAEGIAASILGELVHSPTVVMILSLQGEVMRMREWESIKLVLERSERARWDISVLARELQGARSASRKL
jgi:hypothetical protein